MKIPWTLALLVGFQVGQPKPAGAQTQRGSSTPEVCSSLLPAGFVEALARRYPQHRLIPTARAFHSRPLRCANVASGDYDGDGTPDIAVLISGKRRDESLLVVALRRSPFWKWEHLRTWSGRTGGYVETLSAGRYESAFPVGEIGEVEQHQSALPGVASGDIDASCVVYFRTRDRWVHLWLSD